MFSINWIGSTGGRGMFLWMNFHFISGGKRFYLQVTRRVNIKRQYKNIFKKETFLVLVSQLSFSQPFSQNMTVWMVGMSALQSVSCWRKDTGCVWTRAVQTSSAELITPGFLAICWEPSESPQMSLEDESAPDAGVQRRSDESWFKIAQFSLSA